MRAVGFKKWPSVRADQLTLAVTYDDDYRNEVEYHCRFGFASPMNGVDKLITRHGIPFAARKHTVYLSGVPIFEVEPETCSVHDGMAGMVCAFSDRISIPGNGVFSLAKDTEMVGELLGVATRVEADLGVLMEVVDKGVVEHVVSEMDLTPACLAHSLSKSLVAYHRGAHVSDAALKYSHVPNVEGVAPALVRTIGLYTASGLLSPASLFGVDVVVGATRLIDTRSGNTLELFPGCPKWRD